MNHATPLPEDQFLRIIGPLNANAATPSSEQRSFPRFAVSASAKCQGLDEDWLPIGVPFNASVMNLSRGGVLLSTEISVDAPLVQTQILEGHKVLAEATVSVVRRSAITVAGVFVTRR